MKIYCLIGTQHIPGTVLHSYPKVLGAYKTYTKAYENKIKFGNIPDIYIKCIDLV